MSSKPGKNVPGTELQSEILPAQSYAIPNEPLLSIEHPAILSSVDAGLRTLGGASAISQVLSVSAPIYCRPRRIMQMQHLIFVTVLRTFINIL